MPSDEKIKEKLQQASQMLRSGSKTEAKKLVDEILQESPHDADAWFIASLVTDTLEQKFSALELALQINPQHIKAKEYLLHLKKEISQDSSYKPDGQGVSDVIGKVLSEAVKLIGGWLGLPLGKEQPEVSHEVTASLEEAKIVSSESFKEKSSSSGFPQHVEQYKGKDSIASAKNLSILVVTNNTEKSMNMKFEGNRNDVSDATPLENGLYIISYQYKADDDFPIFNIEIENIDDEEELINISDSQSESKKGAVHKGKQKARLQGGKYVVGVSVNGASSWSIEIIKPE